MNKPNWGVMLDKMIADKRLITEYFINPTPENKEKIKHIKFYHPPGLKKMKQEYDKH